MKIIYIAGPYRAKCEWEVVQNIRRAEEEAIFVWQNGAAALCPHKNTALFGGVPDCPDSVWLEGDLEMMLRCDAIYAIPGWQNSSGARCEVELAISNKIAVLYDRSDVIGFVSDTCKG